MNDQPGSVQGAMTASVRLERHHLRVYRLWDERVRRSLGRFPVAATLALAESLPRLLNRLTAALAEGRLPSIFTEESFPRPNHSLEQILHEFQLLRQVLLDVLEEEAPLETPERNLLLDFLDRELRHDACGFGRQRPASGNEPSASPAARQLLEERDRLQGTLSQLQGEVEYRKRLVATVTHDLRSPLAATKSAAQMIARSPENVEKVRTWAGRIAEAMSRADGMVSNLLDVNRLEAGERITATYALCDLKRVAEELNDELSVRYGDRFHLETEGITLGFWSGDSLRRVLDNLLANAVKYGGSDTPITTRILRVADRVVLSIHNRGSYIPPNERAMLFQPYHRGVSAEASGKSGWGLGLILVKGIVDSHRGTVRVESDPETGTTFIIELPVDARPSGGARHEHRH